MLLTRGRVFKWLYVGLFPVGLLAVYHLQLADTNGYLGFRAFEIDFPYLGTAVASIVVAGMLMPAHLRKPSDFFSWVYGLFVVIPYATLYPIRNPVEAEHFLLYFVVLILPLFAIWLVIAAAPAVRVPALITQRALVWLVALLCIAGLLLAFANPPASAGFELENVYERRLEGRSVFPAGSLSAYLNTAVVNGFAPFLAFIAGWRKKALLLLLSVASCVGFFYLLGLKAPLFFTALALMIGYSVRRRQVDTVIVAIYALVMASFLLFLVEYFLFGFSVVGEFFIRRTFSIPPYFVSAYFEFMSSPVTTGWSPLYGVDTSEPIAFHIGESFLGMPGLNANSNAFLYQLASGGIPLYALTIALVTVVFVALDAVYKCRHNAALIYLGFVYAILLTEQAATTALVSSGIGILILLNIVSRPNKYGTAVSRPLVKRTGRPRSYGRVQPV